MVDYSGVSAPLNPSPAELAQVQQAGAMAPPDPFEPARLLDLFKKLKEESMSQRWVWEREWLRDLYYVSGRQWIMYHPTRKEWVEKRTHKWVPKPVTQKLWEIMQSIRTNLGAINLSVVARPVGSDTQSISAAQIADQMAPLIHEEHLMDQVMRESDFWQISTGNTVLQVSWDKDARFNRTFVASEQCVGCGQVNKPQDIVATHNTCPSCGSTQFQSAKDPTTGKPIGEWVSFGRGKTVALSPFEWAVPGNITRFDELPYLIRLRWRDKHWFESNRPDLVDKLSWEKTPTDRSLQLFKSLAVMNDVGQSAQLMGVNSAANTVEGVTEYELWLKPTLDFPEGLVMRVVGDKSPILLEVPEENVPGPIPYKDIKGSPLFPFVHAQYEHMGGRLYGRSAMSPLIQKQDQLNQLDSLIQLIVQRMANPIWVVPEGAGIDQFSGEPGWVMKWNPLAAGGQGEPKRLSGEDVPSSLYQLREQYIKDLEELSGAFDIIKGQKPTGVEAFSALQLLVERSQSRFTSVFQSRGEMYRKWFNLAIELERSFGPNQRVMAIVGPNRGYTFRHFENAQLQGQVSFQIEDGSNMPKTALGKRAAIEQANQLRLLDPADPDQKYALLQNFGLSDLVPTLNFHVQAALQLQDAFEQWAQAPTGPSPLVIKPWFDPHIHWVERIKWLNSDKLREMIASNPGLEPIITVHLQQLQTPMAPPVQIGPDGKPIQGGPPTGGSAPGGGQALTSSNGQSGAATSSQPSGTKQFGPNVGPT